LALWLLDSDRTNITLTDILDYTKKNSFEEAEHELTKILTEKKLLYVYNDIECAIIPTIADMTKWGIKVDSAYLKKLSVEYHAELEILRKEIYTSAGHEFNINSPQQLGVVLFDELKIGEGKGVRMKKTEGGARSTRESELMKLREHHPIVDKIFAYRELQKLLSTYIDTIPLLIGSDGRVHATFNQAGAATGRFSSDNPNLQNIPIRSESGKKIRNAFVADKGYKLVSFDYSQIELRIAALMSEDTFMIKVFKEGKDIHAAVASRVFGVGESEVTPEMRRRAKIINFGILYGMGVNALRENLGTDRKDAEAFYQNYFAEFPTIQNYLEGVKKNAYAQGFTETLFGRRRYFPGLKSSMPFVRAMAERMAINAPIQGTAADCIKIAMRDVASMLEREKLTESVHLVLQVHDELVYEIEEKDVARASALIEKAMGQVIPQDFLLHRVPVPLDVHVAEGKNWGELK
jgi:DNA polymerase-1